MNHFKFGLIFLLMFSITTLFSQEKKMEAKYVKGRTKISKDKWGEWTTINQSSIILYNADAKKINLTYYKSNFTFRIMYSDMDEKKREIRWFCGGETKEDYAFLIWSYANKQNTFTVSGNTFELIYYLK